MVNIALTTEFSLTAGGLVLVIALAVRPFWQ
jgi:hypothetical protein